MTLSMTTAASPVESCTPPMPVRITKSLLGYGVLAGPVYVITSVAQGLTREGFDFTRHAWSLLSNGSLGWIQVANFALTGLMVLAFAVGLRRALNPGRGATWAPILVGAFGAGLLGGGIFKADPSGGFPVGAPEVGTMTASGMMHLTLGGIGFLGLIAGCMVLASRFKAEQNQRLAWASRITGVLFLAAFVGISSGPDPSPAVVLGFVAAVIIVFTWMAAVAVHLYRRAG